MEERDLDVYNDIMWAAFKDELMGLFYPKGFTEAARERAKEEALEDWRGDPEKVKYMKIIDTELPDDDPSHKIVGVALWHFHPKERTEEELEADAKKAEQRGAGPDCNEPLLEEFFANNAKYKKRIVGTKAHVVLQVLATHPTHHRRGVGKMHLRWGNEYADRYGLPCYLEASHMGKPLYIREGYEVVDQLPFDARNWGHEKELPRKYYLGCTLFKTFWDMCLLYLPFSDYCMLRPAK